MPQYSNMRSLSQWLTVADKPADEMSAVHDPGDFDDIVWARSTTGPVFAEEARTGATCYGCAADLSWVRQHKRNRCGVSFVVRPFFRHPARSSSSNCSNESIEHKAAKDAVVTRGDRMEYFFRCDDCGEQIPWSVRTKGCTYQEEVTWNADAKRFRLDVGILAPGGSVIGAVEILHRHAIPTEKAEVMTNAGLDWCEVTSRRVLDAIRTETFKVQITRCAHTICDGCTEKLRLAEFSRMDEERDAEARAASYTRETRASIIRKMRRDWRKLRGASGVQVHDAKWLQLVTDVTKFASERALELDLTDSEEVHEDVLEGKLLVTFGKYKGMSLGKIQEIDWNYLLWLAGYDFGRLDDKRRAVRRRADARGAEHIPLDIERGARDLVSGKCVKCAGEIEGWDETTWKSLCLDCWRESKLR